MHEPVFSLADLALYTTALLLGWWWCSLDPTGNGRSGE